MIASASFIPSLNDGLNKVLIVPIGDKVFLTQVKNRYYTNVGGDHYEIN